MLFLLAGAGDSGDTFRLPNITLLHFNEREQNRALIPFYVLVLVPAMKDIGL